MNAVTVSAPAALDGQLDALAESFGGVLARPGDAGYDESRAVFNSMVDRRPSVVASCVGVSDVVAALKLAREAGLPIAVRGGGHSVTGHGMCENGVCIDLSAMRAVRVDPAARSAWVQGGATWGDVDRETQAFGLAVPGGRIPSTGVGGLTLGGGSGWIERKFGFSADNLIAADVVTADGALVKAAEDGDAELLWGLKGGGGNFGVVTGFEFRLHEVGPIMLGGMLMFPIERAVEVFRAYRDFIGGAPDEVCGGLAVLCAPPEEFVPEPVRGKPVCGIVASYLGSVEDGERALQPLRDLGPAIDMLAPMPYQAFQRLIEPGNPPGNRHYWKAGFLKELSEEAIETFVSHAADVTSPLTASLMLPLGGAVARVPDDDTPLRFRDAGWNYHLLGQWTDSAEDGRHVEWTRHFGQAMEKHAEEGVYLNFQADEGGDLVRRSFGPEKFARLQALKDRLDPENVFRLNQNIPPSGGG